MELIREEEIFTGIGMKKIYYYPCTKCGAESPRRGRVRNDRKVLLCDECRRMSNLDRQYRNIENKVTKGKAKVKEDILNIIREGEPTEIGRRITIERIYEYVKGESND